MPQRCELSRHLRIAEEAPAKVEASDSDEPPATPVKGKGKAAKKPRKRKEPAPVLRPLFPHSPVRNQPQVKMAVLQRMIVTAPWDRLELAVMLFSADARSWWDVGAAGKWPGGPSDKSKRNAGSALGNSVVLHRRIGLPDLSRVERTYRPEGVDGKRLERERTGVEHTREVDDGIGPIDVADYAFALAHWQRWLEIADRSDIVCSCCRKPVDTSVRATLRSAMTDRAGSPDVRALPDDRRLPVGRASQLPRRALRGLVTARRQHILGARHSAHPRPRLVPGLRLGDPLAVGPARLLPPARGA